MIIDIITLFPKMFHGLLACSILKRACDSSKVKIGLHDLRKYTHDRHRTVDDAPYGGPHGMLMKPEPVIEAVKDIRGRKKYKIVLLSPQGKRFNQKMAHDLASEKRLMMICGHYEGFDERIRTALDPVEVSAGDYVLTGGEIPAMVVLDAVVRLIPGVLGDEASSLEESFSGMWLEYPQYTRPRVFNRMRVPDVLLSGDHKKIEEWRRKESIRRTLLRRPDLIRENKIPADWRAAYTDVRKEVLSNGNG